MRNIESLSLSEIKTILKNYFAIDLIAPMNLALNYNGSFDYKEYICGVIARNIKNRNYNFDIFSARRIKYMYEIVIKKHISKIKEYQEAQENEKKCIRHYFSNVIKAFYRNIKTDYDDCLCFINAVLILEDERNISTNDLFLVDDIYSEIIRRMYTRDQLIRRCGIIRERHTNYAFLKSVMINSEMDAFDSMFIDDEDKKNHIKESKFQLKKSNKDTKKAMQKYINNNIQRIYTK